MDYYDKKGDQKEFLFINGRNVVHIIVKRYSTFRIRIFNKKFKKKVNP
jgi:hypothetical protein